METRVLEFVNEEKVGIVGQGMERSCQVHTNQNVGHDHL